MFNGGTVATSLAALLADPQVLMRSFACAGIAVVGVAVIGAVVSSKPQPRPGALDAGTFDEAAVHPRAGPDFDAARHTKTV